MQEGKTLLIAEPQCKLALELEPWLQAKGCKCKSVTSFKDLLLALQAEKVDVLVMDVCLPEDMGLEAIAIIKSMYKRLPIIVTTEENNAELESQVRKAGIFYYHVTSFGTEDLVLAIANAMARSSR